VPDSRTTKVFLVSFIAFLFAQFVVAYYWTEPYPAVIEPGFLGSPPTTGRATIRGYRVVATRPGASALVLDADKFFNGVPSSYLMFDLPFLLDSTPPALSGWQHVRNRLFRQAKLRSDAGLPEFAVYAERRLSDLTGRADWKSLRIEETLRDVDVAQLEYIELPRVHRSRTFRLQ
jgi:hypothetical protein